MCQTDSLYILSNRQSLELLSTELPSTAFLAERKISFDIELIVCAKSKPISAASFVDGFIECEDF